MPTARRIHTLELTGKLRDRAVEEVAVRLGALRAGIAEIEAARAELVAARRARPSALSLEAAPYLSGFLQATRDEEARLDERRAALEAELRQVEAELRERFREAKVNERLLSRAREARRDAQERAEAMALDEIALRNFQGRR